jgi:hypothetical protein
MPCENTIDDCELGKLPTEMLFRMLLRNEDGCLYLNIKPKPKTITITSIVKTNAADSPVVAGKKSVVFNTSEDFVGTINGVSRPASSSIVFPAGDDLTPAIPYTISSGSITIDITT